MISARLVHFPPRYSGPSTEIPAVHSALSPLGSVDFSPVGGATPPEPLPGITPCGIMSAMAGNVLQRVLEHLFIEASPLPPLRIFKACYEELIEIWKGNYTLQRRLEELEMLLDRLDKLLVSANGVIPEETRELRAWLEAARPWLKSVSQRWMALEQIQNQPSLPGKALELMSAIQKLLADPLLHQDYFGGIVQSVDVLRQILSQVVLWQKLPPGANLADYLDIVMGNPQLVQQLDASLLQLGQALRQTLAAEPYPAAESLSQRLGWLSKILARPGMDELLRPQLVSLLGGSVQADSLLAVFKFASLLGGFPAKSGSGEQAIWLLNIINQERPALPWLRQFQRALDIDSQVLTLLNRLLTLNSTPENWALLMRDVARAAAPGIGLWAVGRWLPTHAAQALETFYRETSADESWTSLLQRMASGFMTVAKPYLIEQLMGDPLAAATVQYAEALQNHLNWEQTLQWFVTQAQEQAPALHFAYAQYLNARLACQIFQAFNSQYQQEIEDRLRLLARQLKDCQLVRYYPQLEKLVDVLPLLPALREVGKTLGERSAAGSWIEWGNQWLNSLANSDNTSVREACERLSHQVEAWLADAVVSACDSLVQQPWGLLPGAEAASIAPPRNYDPQPDSGWGQVAACVSLEALGLAAVGYALWSARQDEIAASDFGALWQQKTPLLLGIAAMSVGGVLLYRRVATPRTSVDDLRRIHQLIAEVEVDSLEFVFDSPQFVSKPAVESIHVASRERRSAEDEGEIEEEGLASQIEEVLHNEDMGRAIRTEYQRIFTRAKRESEVLEVPPGKTREIRQLLKTMELFDAFVNDAKSAPGMSVYNSLNRNIQAGLLALADGQINDFSKSIVDRYRRSFRLAADETVNIVATSNGEHSISDLAFQNLCEVTLVQVAQLYHPILNPQSYIEDYIRTGIRNYEQRSGTVMNLLPDSYIWVTYYPKVHPNMNANGHAGPVPVKRFFTLTEIVTGHYLYESRQMRDPVRREYEITGMDHQSLVDHLTAENLQSRMEEELQAYRNNPANVVSMKSFYNEMITLRCLDYLSRPHQVPIYWREVKAFLEGQINARTVLFRGTVLNGVFLIPAGPSGGVLFCVDEEIFFLFGSYPHEYWETVTKVEMLTAFPQNARFKEWVLSKIPAWHAMEHENDDRAFRYLTNNLMTPGIYSGPKFINKVIDHPFTFADCSSRDVLVSKLFDGLMTRIESDIDTSVFSYSEHITAQILEAAKRVFGISSIALSTFIPGTGSVLARFSLFMTSLTLNALYVGTSALQSHLSERPDQAQSFRTDATLAGVMASIDLVTGALPLLRQSAKRTFMIKNVNQSIQFYRSARATSLRVLPVVLSEMNWNRLPDGRKVKQLVTTLQDGERARRLAQLTSRKVVEQSIRNNLLLDYEGLQKKRLAWGTYAVEQASAQRRLNSDYTRLVNTNTHVHRLLDNPPIIPRQKWLGKPVDVATDWIASKSRSPKTLAQSAELKNRIKTALISHHSADLLDISTIESLHNAVYQPVEGHTFRAFRSSSDPIFMGSDIARSGFLKMLNRLETRSFTGEMNLADALYTTIVRYHPFGDGNGRTARAMYALARLQKGESPFIALSKMGEDMLNPPGVLS